jgi:hypothetical protein
MAVDRGGLRYTIRVEDKFSAGLKKFRSEIAGIRRELNSLRTAQGQLNATRRQASAGAGSANREQLEQLRRVQAATRQQAANEQLRANINRTQRREASRAAREDIALFRRRKSEEAQAAKARSNALRRQQAEQLRANRATRGGAQALDKVTRSARRAEGGINRVAFTFRRMVGIFAAFQAARAGADLFRQGIAQGIQFNQTIEDSQISLAALFTAAGRVSTEQGKMLQGAEAFAAAQAEARRQTGLLRNDALGTTATFQELLRAFQAGVGPGLEAGLKLDEIREVTVRVSQAAAALTVPQNQLIEEIRSLLRGTIQARTTIVASVLGISNEDIKKAKETGNLFNFLRKRLGPFAEAAEATRGSFTGLVARIRDASAAVTGEAAVTLFNTIKNSLLDLFNTLVSFDEETGQLIANADAVAAIQPIYDALAQTILDLRRAAEGINLSTITVALTAIGEAIRILVNLGAGVIQGVVDGVADLAGLFGLLSDNADGIKLETLVEMLRTVTRIGTVLLGMNLTFGLLKAVISGLIGPVLAVGRGVFAISTSMAALAGTTKGLAIAMTSGVLLALIGVGVALKTIIDDFAGFNVKLSTFFRIIADGFVNLVTVVGAVVNLIFQTITDGAVDVIASFISNVSTRLANFLQETAQAISGALPATAEQLDQASLKFREIAGDFARAGRLAAAEVKEAEEDLARASLKFFEDLNAAINDDADGLAPTAAEAANSFLAGFTDTVKEGLNALFPDLLGGEDALTDAKEAGKQQGKAIVEGRNEAEEEASPLEKYLQGIVTNFENGLALLRPMISAFSSFVSDAIVSAFDPTDDTTLLERFARFLQQIAKLIINQLVQIAIAKAILGFGFGAGGGGGGGTTLVPGSFSVGGLAEGGDVPDKAAPRMARPKGLDPRDTTPIWAQPGEFMVKKSIVDQPAVREFLHALNSGLIGSSALKDIIGGRSSRRHISGLSRRGPQGYAEGGIISGTLDAAGASSRSATQNSQPTPAFLVSNDQTMEKLMAGGGQAFRRYLEDNASEIDGILRKGRTGG